MEDIRIFIVDDHQLFIDGLKAILNRTKGMVVVETAISGRECLEKIRNIEIDVLITDISMPNMKGEELVEHLIRIFPSMRILTLSMHDDYDNIDKMLRAGVLGYILKNTGAKELREAIETVAKGDNYFTAKVSDSIAMGYVRENKKTDSPNIPVESEVFLTRREKGILKLVFKGLSSQEIADELSLSYHTITQHRKNINAKLGTSNKIEIEKIVEENALLE